MMKRFLSLTLACFLLLALMAGCSTTPVEVPSPSPSAEAPTETPTETPTTAPEKITVQVGALKGPTGAGLVQLMESADKGTAAEDWSFTLSSDPSEMMSKVISGDLDLAAVPTNVASVLYNKTEGAVQIVAVNTLGVLHILQRTGEGATAITSLEELRGKTLYTTGQGANPEYIINYLLRGAGLEPGTDVTVEFLTTNDELLAKMADDASVEFVMIAEPSATAAMLQIDGFSRALDVNTLWNETATDGSALTMGCIVVRREFAEAHPEAVSAFLTEYQSSVDFVNNDLENASVLIESYGIVPKAAIAKQALPQCNIVMISGQEIRPALEGYLNVLFSADPTSVGGAVPGEDFYYLP